MNDYRLITFADMPALYDMEGDIAQAAWPEFMLHDNIATYAFGDMLDAFPQFQFGLFTPEDRLAAVGNSIPFQWDAPVEQLPDQGWDFVLERGLQDGQAGRTANMLSAISIAIHPDWRGQSLSKRMVEGLRRLAVQHGLQGLVAPVRPSLKSQYPLIPMQKYAAWTRADGAPFDPWLRVHWQLGARILHTAENSMLIQARVSDWEEWTGMHFPGSGDYLVPGALSPVQIDLEKDQGVYIEPNVWMQHTLPQSAEH